METVTVQSWNELIEALFKEAWSPKLERFRSKEAYRGLSDVTYPLDTSLMRLGGDYPKLERHLLRNFRKYAHRNMVERDSIWHWLSLAQHHGLPTRLLDWTYSPLVAMHFATANLEKFDIDGVIWAVNYVNVHKLLPEKFLGFLNAEGANVFTVDMLAEAIGSLEILEAFAKMKFTLFMEPPSMDDRIVNQHAFFSCMANPQDRIDQLIEQKDHFGRKIIIPSDLKWEIRDKLDQANITERVLFPGLDSLSSWLKRQYTPKHVL